MINILVLAAGRVGGEVGGIGSYPNCLAERDGVSVLEYIVNNLKKIAGGKFTFVFHAQDISKHHLNNIAKLLVADSSVTVVPESTKGSGCTALLAACKLDTSLPLLIVSANELVEQDMEEVIGNFSEKDLDAGTIVFRSVQPRYSYVKTDVDGFVVEAAQQNPISHNATAGIFWYKKTSDFVEAAKCSIRKNASTDGVFYLAPIFNNLILDHKKIGTFEIANKNYFPLKTSNQVQQFESSKL